MPNTNYREIRSDGGGGVGFVCVFGVSSPETRVNFLQDVSGPLSRMCHYLYSKVLCKEVFSRRTISTCKIFAY